jgi:hypothetical protein
MSQNWTPPPASGGGAAPVPNNLVIAIISVVCCFPLGIPAIIFATQVNNKAAAGDIAGAQEAAKKAKMFAMIGIGLWLLCVVIYVILLILGVGLSAMGNR